MSAGPSIRRVLMTADTVGGVWTFALELSAALRPHGIEVLLAAMGGEPSPSERIQAARIPNLRLEAADYRLEWMDDAWSDVAAAGEWLLDLEARFAPDIVHLNSYAHGALRWRAPVVMTAHSCVLSWWSAVHGEPAPPRWDRYRAEVTRGLHAAATVTAPSAFMLRELERHYGAPANAAVIHNGRAAARFTPLAKRPFILSAGRVWDRAKNAGVLESIAADLDWPVYVAGEQRHPDGGEQRFEHCRALGRLNPAALRRWYGHAAIYALPARYEPFGLSALEAALAGCALVLAEIPSLREIWRDAAVFIPPDDGGAWMVELNRLAAEPEQRREMAARARDRAREFTPGRMGLRYVECYAGALREWEAACVS